MKSDIRVPLQSSGSTSPPWYDARLVLKFKPLSEDLSVDVVIVGAGIAGLSVAYFLTEAGKNVAVVEDGFIGSGETGRTTAHLAWALDDRFFNLEKIYGQDGARLAGESHKQAIDAIERIVRTEKIECDFERMNGYLFLGEKDKENVLDDELATFQRIGFTEVRLVDKAPLGSFDTGKCLCFPNQGQFHPLKYLAGLAKAIVNKGGKIFTETHAEKIDENGISSGDGYKINAHSVVVATNVPVHTTVTMHTKQAPYRTYVIGALIKKDSVPRALYWDTAKSTSSGANAYHYARTQPYNKELDLLIVGGEDHKTGQANDGKNRFKKLETWAKNRFSIKKIAYLWSGQVVEPIDYLAFIGLSPGSKNTYLATGDSGNGMTHGTIAGMLISDLILGNKNPWASLYDPSRKSVMAAKEFLEENINVAKQYVDLLKEEKGRLLVKGEGKIVQEGVNKIAIYKDEKGTVHKFSAICPHLKCVVRWNRTEKTFDCPCHGSRFSCMGEVTNGPANSSLQPYGTERAENPGLRKK